MATSLLTTGEVAARFEELARQEKWFEIQDELFADHVRSVDPPDSPYFGYAEGKAAVRQKGLNWINKIEGVHGTHTGKPLIAGSHFAIARGVDITVKGFGRIQPDEVMVYKVKNGRIVLEQFFH